MSDENGDNDKNFGDGCSEGDAIEAVDTNEDDIYVGNNDDSDDNDSYGSINDNDSENNEDIEMVYRRKCK